MKKTLTMIVLLLFLLGTVLLRAQTKTSKTGELARMARKTFQTAFEHEAVRAAFGLDEKEAEAVFSAADTGAAL